MVEAYVLIQTVVGRTHHPAVEIAKIEGGDRAQTVTGPHDVIARWFAPDFDTLQQVEYQIELVEGITRALTAVVTEFWGLPHGGGVMPPRGLGSPVSSRFLDLRWGRQEAGSTRLSR